MKRIKHYGEWALRGIAVLFLFSLTAIGQSGAAQAKACGEAEHRQFDFWVGDWKIKQKILKADGTWFETDAETAVRATLDGCALIEDWRGEVLFFWEGMKVPQTIKGLSVRAFNPSARKWSINWMDTRNLRFGEHAGVFADGRGEFFRKFKGADGREMATRITFSDITKTSVHWDLSVSSDNGKTWQTLWVMEMRR